MLQASGAAPEGGGSEAQDVDKVVVEEEQFAALFPQLLRAQASDGCIAAMSFFCDACLFLRSFFFNTANALCTNYILTS